MKFWSIQTDKILHDIDKYGVHHPHNGFSYFVSDDNERMGLYTLARHTHNNLNNIKTSGVIFAWAQPAGQEVVEIKDYNSFVSLLNSSSEAAHIRKALKDRGGKILELEYSQEEVGNPVYIDFNDWQFFMPPVSIDEASLFTLEQQYGAKLDKPTIKNMFNCLKEGIYTPSKISSGIIQAHLPYIKKENIINTYDLSEII